ncbi:MAG: hypothetical protein IJ168_11065 [Eubacterium sp.]|nr:hypothetical protein [Eubacterium sp.]
MPNAVWILAGVAAVLLLGIVIVPVVNRRQFNKLPAEQKVRILMKEARSLSFFKNVSSGSSGTLYYIKNKRKIYAFPWKLKDGSMVCTRTSLFDRWDYPEEQPAFTEDEVRFVSEELHKYNEKNAVKLLIEYDVNK